MGWNLPDGCSQLDVDRAVGDYYESDRDQDDEADEQYEDFLAEQEQEQQQQ